MTWKKPHSLLAWCNFSSSESINPREKSFCMSMTGTWGKEAVESEMLGGSWSERTYRGGTVAIVSFASSWTQGTGRELPSDCSVFIAPRKPRGQKGQKASIPPTPVNEEHSTLRILTNDTHEFYTIYNYKSRCLSFNESYKGRKKQKQKGKSSLIWFMWYKKNL